MRAEPKHLIYEDLDMMVNISFFFYLLTRLIPVVCTDEVPSLSNNRYCYSTFKENHLVHVVHPNPDSV